MKRIVLSVVLAACASQCGYASDTLFLSQQFHLIASYYHGNSETFDGGAFDITASDPVSYSITDGDGWAQASGWTTPAGANSALVGVSGGYFTGASWEGGPFVDPFFVGHYNVTGRWTFRPAADELGISGGDQEGGYYWIGLTDLTTGQVLIDDSHLAGGGMTGYVLSAADPTHVYELRLHTEDIYSVMQTFSPHTMDNAVEMRLDGLAAVPTPGALLLVGVGLGLVGWLRDRRILAQR